MSTVRRRRLRAARRAAYIQLMGIWSAVITSCAPTTNLLNPTTPRFSGNYANPLADSASGLPLRIVTFNIKLARQIDRAVEVLQSDSLQGADIIALQEMDDAGVERIARVLKLNYVYYPSSIHPTDQKYYGPAILSRWPIEQSWKLLLPHLGRFRRQQRTATAVVLRVRNQRMKVYAVHLETQLRISEAARRDQVLEVLADAYDFQGPVVIAGDFNSHGIGPLLVRHGYRWITASVGPSVAFFAWDHIFVRHLAPSRPASAGVVREVLGASDHRPVWAVVIPDRPAGLGVEGPLVR